MTLSDATVLITGGSGFIGAHLVRRLLPRNHVTVLDRRIVREAWMQAPETRGRLRLIEADVRELDQLRAACAGHDVIVHAAAIAGVTAVQESPISTLDGSVLGTRNVLEVASELDDLRRVVLLSTSEVTGPVSDRVAESDGVSIGPAAETRWAYAMGKAVGEYYAHAFHIEKALPTVVLRPFNVYGPGQTGEGAVRNFVAAALSGTDLMIQGDGTEVRSWTFVADMVEAIESAISITAAIGQVFNIGHPGAAVTTVDLARQIVELSGSTARIRFESAIGPRVRVRIPNVDKAQDVLGFNAKTDLTDGLNRTIASYA